MPLEATPSKPQSHSRVPCAESYKSVTIENVNNIKTTGLDNILDMLGGGWRGAWQSALRFEGAYSVRNMRRIADMYSESDPAEGNALGCNEEVYQDRLNHLMLAISEFLPARSPGDIARVRWVDTHANPMPNGRKLDGRKLDGLIVLCDTGDTPQWYHTVAAFELKSDKHGAKDKGLVGQLIANFRDMAENQPRRRSIGFTVSRNGKMHMYLCTQDQVYHAPVDAPPGTTIEMEHHRLVRLLMVVLVQLPTDLGFVVNTRYGMSGRFGAADIPGYARKSDTMLSDEAVYIQDTKAFSGRRRNAVGPRSWLYRAEVDLPEDANRRRLRQHNCIFKFHLHRDNHSEATVHKRALDMRVPYVPRLLGSAMVVLQGSFLMGAILLIEDCGEDIGQFYIDNKGPGGLRATSDAPVRYYFSNRTSMKAEWSCSPKPLPSSTPRLTPWIQNTSAATSVLPTSRWLPTTHAPPALICAALIVSRQTRSAGAKPGCLRPSQQIGKRCTRRR
ncbi:hypothetical protein H4R19_003765 [Coemansia spiralis]|nr:hypothetical protein H4R19_003765 [Coemansia spiralis]